MDDLLSLTLPKPQQPTTGAATAFYAIAAQRLTEVVRPAFAHLLRRAAQHPRAPAWLVAIEDRWHDEAWAVLNVCVQAQFLSMYGACAEERAVGVGRRRVDGTLLSAEAPLTTREITGSLCGAVVWPYIRRRLDAPWLASAVAPRDGSSDAHEPERRDSSPPPEQSIVELDDGDEDNGDADDEGVGASGRATAAGASASAAVRLLRRLRGLVRRVVRVARAAPQFLPDTCRALVTAVTAVEAAYLFAHAYGVTRFASPWLQLAGLELVAPPPDVPLKTPSDAPGATQRPNYSMAWRALRIAVVGVFVALKVAQWARTARHLFEANRRARALDVASSLPPPTPLPTMPRSPWQRDASAVVGDGGEASLCPRCGLPPTRPTAVPSGVVYCADCVTTLGKCIVTGDCFDPSQLVRLFEL